MQTSVKNFALTSTSSRLLLCCLQQRDRNVKNACYGRKRLMLFYNLHNEIIKWPVNRIYTYITVLVRPTVLISGKESEACQASASCKIHITQSCLLTNWIVKNGKRKLLILLLGTNFNPIKFSGGWGSTKATGSNKAWAIPGWCFFGEPVSKSVFERRTSNGSEIFSL